MLSSLQDSLLKQRIKSLINESQQTYNRQSAGLQTLLAAGADKQIRIDDYYTALKIIKTLPLLEKYQKDQLPVAQPYKELNQKRDTIFITIQKKVTQ